MFWKIGANKSKRSRVLFLHLEASNSGSTRLFLDFLRYLGKQELEFSPILCFFRAGPLLGHFESLGFPVLVFNPDTNHLLRVRTRFERIASLMWFATVLARIRPILLYSNTVTTSTSVLVAGCFGIRTIVHVHEGPRYLDMVGASLRFSARVTSRFIAVSKYCANGVLGVLHRSADIVHNWTPVKKKQPQEARAAEIPAVIGIVGTIDRNKQHLLALLAICSLKEKYRAKFRLKIIGPVADAACARDLIQVANLIGVSDLVEMAGAAPNTEAIYPSLDIVLIPSMEETFSLVALEAAQYGKPIVAADVGGIREAITTDADTIFFRAGDWRSLAAALEGALHKSASIQTESEPTAVTDLVPSALTQQTGPERLLELIRTELTA